MVAENTPGGGGFVLKLDFVDSEAYVCALEKARLSNDRFRRAFSNDAAFDVSSTVFGEKIGFENTVVLSGRSLGLLGYAG